MGQSCVPNLLLTGWATLGPISLTAGSVRWNERQQERETQGRILVGAERGLRRLSGNFSCGSLPTPFPAEARLLPLMAGLGKCVSPPYSEYLSKLRETWAEGPPQSPL